MCSEFVIVTYSIHWWKEIGWICFVIFVVKEITTYLTIRWTRPMITSGTTFWKADRWIFHTYSPNMLVPGERFGLPITWFKAKWLTSSPNLEQVSVTGFDLCLLVESQLSWPTRRYRQKSGWDDLNAQLTGWKPAILPIELHPHKRANERTWTPNKLITNQLRYHCVTLAW